MKSMNENDTFAALKKWSYEDANTEYEYHCHHWNERLFSRAKFKELTGWTWEELYDEYKRRDDSVRYLCRIEKVVI